MYCNVLYCNVFYSVCICIHACIYRPILPVRPYIYTYIHTHIHTHRMLCCVSSYAAIHERYAQPEVLKQNHFVCIVLHLCMVYVCIYIYIWYHTVYKQTHQTQGYIHACKMYALMHPHMVTTYSPCECNQSRPLVCHN